MLSNPNTQSSLKQTLVVNFHTKYALNLIEGTSGRKHNIAGLLVFASKIKQVERDAEASNPYAKYYFNKAKSNLDIASKEINKTSNYCDDEIVNTEKRGIIILPSENINPTQKTFNFTVSMCYKIVMLITDYDLCVRKLQSIFNTGLITENEFHEKINVMGKCLRSLFHSAEGYVSTPVTIQDIQEGNEIAIEAKNKMSNVQLFN